MAGSKEHLEDRLGGASLVINECNAILSAVARAVDYAKRSGHTSLIGEVAAVRRATLAARQKANVVSEKLRERIQAADFTGGAQ